MTIARDTVMGEEAVYGIATGNRFAMVEIGDDIEDPSEFYTLIEKEKAEKKKADKKKKDKKQDKKKEDEKKPEPKKEEEQKDTNTRGKGRGRGRGNNRGRNDNRRYNRDEDGSRPPRLQEGEEKQGEDGQEKKRTGSYRGRGGNNRRGGSGRGNYRGRQYDRHSGSDRSGVKPQDKREGGGAHNWGSPTDDNTAQDWGNNNTSGDSGAWGNVQDASTAEPSGFDNVQQASGFDNVEVVGETPAEGDAENAEEAGPEQLTFEEYQAKLAQEKKEKLAFNIRKAGENEDDSQWKNFAPLKKESQDNYMGGNDEYEKIIVRGGRKKNLVDLDVKFSTPSRRGGSGGSGGGSGDRNNNRSNRGRNDRRSDHGRNDGGSHGGRSAALNLENTSEFPSLS